MTGIVVIFRNCFANEPKKNIELMMCGLKDMPLCLFRCSVCSTRYSMFSTVPPCRSLPTKSKPVCVCVLNGDSVFILNYTLACIINTRRGFFYFKLY